MTDGLRGTVPLSAAVPGVFSAAFCLPHPAWLLRSAGTGRGWSRRSRPYRGCTQRPAGGAVGPDGIAAGTKSPKEPPIETGPASEDLVALGEEKQKLRRRMRALRLVVDQKDGADAALAIMRHLMASRARLGIHTGTVVTGYWPISTEVDVRPLLSRLHESDAICGLPVVVAANKPLIFRRWHPEDDLEDGVYGTRHPHSDAPEVSPDVIIAPLLAVDRDGARLGHGGGYYDRTVAALRRRGRLTVVGVGYAIQLVERVPRSGLDQRVDWVLTDAGLVRIGE